MTQEEKTPQNIMKFAYSWIIINLIVTIFYGGYLVSDLSYMSQLSEQSMLGYAINSDLSTNKTLEGLESIKEKTNVDDLTTSESVAGDIFDSLDKLWSFGKWTWFIIQFITMGLLFNTLILTEMIGNVWVAFLIGVFTMVGNVIFTYLIVKELMNKFKFGG